MAKRLLGDKIIRLNRTQNKLFDINDDVFYVDPITIDPPPEVGTNYLNRSPSTLSGSKEIPLETIFADDSKRLLHITGSAGIGKSTLMHNVVNKWTNEEIWNDKFDFVFYFRGRDLGNISERCSLQDIVFNICAHDMETGGEANQKIIRHIKENRHRVLIVIDGLDELSSWCHAAKTNTWKTVDGFHDQVEVHNVINGLITGKMLVGIHVLISSRPIEVLVKYTFDSRILILGFNKEQAYTCMIRVCKGDENNSLRK